MFNKYVVAIGIACALYAREPDGKQQSQEAMADNLYEAVRASGYDDEVKAELYARLADILTPTTTFKQAHALIEDCLNKTRGA